MTKLSTKEIKALIDKNKVVDGVVTIDGKDVYICEFCEKAFMTQNGFDNHMCEKKARWIDRGNRATRIAYETYSVFNRISYRKIPTILDFVKSRYYEDFMKFSRFIEDNQVINPLGYAEFLVTMKIPITNWRRDFIYDQYIRELNKRETHVQALERNILLMEQWAMSNNNVWVNFFKEVNTNDAIRYIQSGRLSPWLIYAMPESASLLFDRFTEEQCQIVNKSINVKFWDARLKNEQQALDFIKLTLKEAGV